MSNPFLAVLSLLALSFSLSSCDTIPDEVVETAYIYPPTPDPSYSFKRNGASSVDFLECQLVKEPLDHIYESFLLEANIQYPANMARVMEYFNQGEFGWSPRQRVAASTLHVQDSAAVLRDFQQVFVSTAQLSGLGQTVPSTERNQRATVGKGGFVGIHIGDVNLCFADDRGVVVAEMFKGMVQGAVYLDQMLNVHLDDAILLNDSLRTAHENGRLLPGRNYTALEHHWDLAWGYYQFWLPLVEVSGYPALQRSRITLYNAFALGRLALTEYRYDDALQQLRIIRTELSKVAAAHALFLLTGARTINNLQESPANALPFLSQALGAVYALTFTRQADGAPHFSYAETKTIIQSLTADKGLWDNARLLGTSSQHGVLHEVATQIGSRYALSFPPIQQ